ncbi:MAG: hypothetical protein HON90_12400, partial [Halobacteriovoraceae bacterium]|nr:hypothetical protein [Halobacteriovoraceae bacterium]
MSISLFGIWKMLQSEWVADRISTLATGYIREVLHAEVKFNNLEFNLFPPGARVKDIKIVGQKEGISFSAEADSLGVYFNPLDSFKTDFIIDKIIASEGYVEIKTTKQAKKKKGARESKFDLDNLELIKKLPIKRVIVSEYIIKVNSQVLTTNFLEVKNLKEGLRIDTSFENIPLDGYGGLPRKTIDQVKIQAKIDRGRIEIDSLKMKSGFVVVEASGNIQNYVSKNIKYNLKYKLSLPVNTVHEWVSFEDVGLLAKGICVAEGTVRGQSLNVNAESIIKLKNFETDFLNG